MKLKVLSLLATGMLLSGLTACSDDDWTVVDGAEPTVDMAVESIRTEAGQTINIRGTLADADGIKSILLWCPDLYMKKTIDLIDIYGEPQKEYELDYSYTISRCKNAEKYDVEITVTDVAGKETKRVVTVTLDGDFSAPVFVTAPSAETSVLLENDRAVLPVEFCVTDNRGIDKIVLSLNYYDLSTKETGEAAGDDFPIVLDGMGEDTYELGEEFELPAQEGAYILTVEAFDLPAQDGDVRSTVVTSVITVLGGVDFAKMYLCDVATAAELNSDIFGVPMRVDKVGECQYRARYYNKEANTEIFFIPQTGALSPICYGVDPTDSSRLINAPGNALPLVLPQAKTYYEINFNTETGAYDVKTYVVESYMNPVIWEYGSQSLNTWGGWVDTGTDDWVPAADAWMQEFYFGYATDPTDVIRFVKDKDNPNLYYWDEPKHFDAGEDPKFIIHNWHSHGWWNEVTWRVDNGTDCDIFYYYGNVVKQAYLDWFYGEGVVSWSDWKGGEDIRKQMIYNGGGDIWCQPHVNFSGDYVLYFDAHLGRAKLVPAK